MLPGREGCRVWDVAGMKSLLGWDEVFFWAGKPELLGVALPLRAKPGTGQRLC